MRGSWRPLVVAAAINVTVGAGLAAAQTMTVTSVPPGMTVELALNAAVIETAKADEAGRATLPINLSAHAGKTDTDVQIFVEICEGVRRVLLVEPGRPTLPISPCPRKEIAGLYVVRPVTSFVLDFTQPSPWVRLKQGKAPAAWLSWEPDRPRAASTTKPSPRGLMLFGGGGVGHFKNVVDISCGNTTDCSGGATKLAYTAGATFWLTRYLAVEGGYFGHLNVDTEGSAAASSFNSTFSTHVWTIVGKLGLPLGKARPYIMGGTNYHQGTSTTSQTIDNRTVTIGDVQTVINGGTQQFELKTEGWGWLFGGGVEVPVGGVLALYTEAGYIKLKGSDVAKSEAKLEDSMSFAVAGIRIRLGR